MTILTIDEVKKENDAFFADKAHKGIDRKQVEAILGGLDGANSGWGELVQQLQAMLADPARAKQHDAINAALTITERAQNDRVAADTRSPTFAPRLAASNIIPHLPDYVAKGLDVKELNAIVQGTARAWDQEGRYGEIVNPLLRMADAFLAAAQSATDDTAKEAQLRQYRTYLMAAAVYQRADFITNYMNEKDDKGNYKHTGHPQDLDPKQIDAFIKSQLHRDLGLEAPVNVKPLTDAAHDLLGKLSPADLKGFDAKARAEFDTIIKSNADTWAKTGTGAMSQSATEQAVELLSQANGETDAAKKADLLRRHNEYALAAVVFARADLLRQNNGKAAPMSTADLDKILKLEPLAAAPVIPTPAPAPAPAPASVPVKSYDDFYKAIDAAAGGKGAMPAAPAPGTPDRLGYDRALRAVAENSVAAGQDGGWEGNVNMANYAYGIGTVMQDGTMGGFWQEGRRWDLSLSLRYEQPRYERRLSFKRKRPVYARQGRYRHAG